MKMYADYFEQETRIEPVRKQLMVGLPVEAAFKLFTEGMGRWWPLMTHSVGEEQAETCFLEGWVGGRIVEVLKDGSQSEWGRVLTWEPHQQVSFQWYPGREPDTAQVVRVTFSEIPTGTLVELVHVGWETLGDKAQATRDGYETGWDYVLAKYAAQVSNPSLK
jgi:uncharacterized protein YndB with AHSA1/START domain